VVTVLNARVAATARVVSAITDRNTDRFGARIRGPFFCPAYAASGRTSRSRRPASELRASSIS
jgi:hypothetical protein